MSTPVIATYTEHACGEGCWRAADDVCRCSCGGKNHGCLRSADGVRPVRTARIMGSFHQLVAVGSHPEIHEQAVAINTADGETFYFADSARDMDAKAKTRRATDAQVESWPELAGMRSWKISQIPVYLLWVKA